MKNKNLLAYALLFVQLTALIIAAYMLFDYTFSSTGLLKRPRIHLSVQIMLSVFTLYSVYRFLKIKSVSDKMRKQAQDQRMARSKSVELLIFMLLVNIIFYSLFFTYSPGRYNPTIIENTTYISCLALQFFLIAQLVSVQSANSKNSKKVNYRFSAAGAVIGLILYCIYYISMT